MLHWLQLFLLFIQISCASMSEFTETTKDKKEESPKKSPSIEKPSGKGDTTSSKTKGMTDTKKEEKDTKVTVVVDDESATENNHSVVVTKDVFKKDSPSTKTPTTISPTYKKESSGLKASFSDDNKQFGYFVNFLEKYKEKAGSILNTNIADRIVFKVKDQKDLSLFHADVIIRKNGQIIEKGKTYADGTYLFFPSESKLNTSKVDAEIIYNQISQKIEVNLKGKRQIDVKLPTNRILSSPISLDIVFIFDTTGSMGEEIERLRSTIEIINMNLSNIKPKANVRFGMVLYKDKGDEYRTKIIPLTDDLDKFQKELNQVTADGGGDLPEDLQEGLKHTLKTMNWNPDSVQLGYIITDAPAHIDYSDQNYNYVQAAKDAKSRAIKLHSIGTGELPLTGEYMLRQISQYTYGRYIFLTYGEKGESEGGKVGSVSHHTGDNFQTDKLETIIIRFAKEELNHLSSQLVQTPDDFFIANSVDSETKEETLKNLFTKAVDQLVDLSTIKIDKQNIAILPITAKDVKDKINAEYFTEQLLLSSKKNNKIKIVDRTDMQKILNELKYQQLGIIDEEKSAKIGKLLGADILIVGTLFSKSTSMELFLKFVRVETGEVLSVTKAKIESKLSLP